MEDVLIFIYFVDCFQVFAKNLEMVFRTVLPPSYHQSIAKSGLYQHLVW